MKTGRSLADLAIEIERQRDSKADYIADTRELTFQPKTEKDPSLVDSIIERTEEMIQINGHGSFPITNYTHRQIASRLQIPQKYYDRMRDTSQDLLAENVNHWFQAKPEKRMIRTLDNNARAFLSNRYRTLDHNQILESVLPIFGEMAAQSNMELQSCEVTDNRLYLKVVYPKIEGEIKLGDVVQAGAVVSNSEIGLGAINVQPLLYRLVCFNGMIRNDHAMRKYHIGRASGSELAERFFKDETMKADDQAFMLKLKDIVIATTQPEFFNGLVDEMKETTERKLDDPVKTVELVQKNHGLNETEGKGVLNHLIEGGDLSQYGLINAVTRTSQDVDDYDRATDLEILGGKLVDVGAFKNVIQ